MDTKNQIIKHLEMIQSVINRLAFNSFLIKGWSITILIAMFLFIANAKVTHWLVLCAIIPILLFWKLDGYFLRQERLFRHLYDDVRETPTTDFDMSTGEYKDREKIHKVCFSITLSIFYPTEMLFVIVAFITLLLTN